MPNIPFRNPWIISAPITSAYFGCEAANPGGLRNQTEQTMRVSLLRTTTLALALIAVLGATTGAFAAPVQYGAQQQQTQQQATHSKMAPTLWE
ncbi:MAG TPA: hypothetical protein VGP48_00475 [Stellaceae bacterium]|jgi:hypothetical protein|nr:hypothetical protein [Stellaceae bacterium]